MVAADVVVAPLLSTATAVMAKLPTRAFVQFIWYGGVVRLPINEVPAKNATCATLPSTSNAFAANVSGPGAEIVVSTAGAVSVTLGAALPAGPQPATARARFRRPPVIVRPASDGIGSTLLRMSVFSAAVVSEQRVSN